MNLVRKRRLIVVLLVLAAAAVAASLAVLGLQHNANYLFSPSEIDSGDAPEHDQFRLGGVVKKNSVQHADDSLETHFVVTDRFHDMPVAYDGILPDLFREGQSVVTTGHMDHGTFVADTVLAKHDETYMSPQVKDAIAKARKKNGKAPADTGHAAPGNGQGGQ